MNPIPEEDVFGELPRWRIDCMKRLVPAVVSREDGFGPEVDLGMYRGKLLVITLGIDSATERQGLMVSIWGSADQVNWGPRPLVTFPQKQYCGVYSTLLNLARCGEVRYLRVEWKMRRWGTRSMTPMFSFYVFAEESGARLSPAVA